ESGGESEFAHACSYGERASGLRADATMRGDMRRFAAVAVPVLLVLLLAIWRAEGPVPKPASAPPNEFSSVRAMAALRELAGSGTPHPIGTPANKRVRGLVYARLRALGSPVDMHQTFAGRARPACGKP